MKLFLLCWLAIGVGAIDVGCSAEDKGLIALDKLMKKTQAICTGRLIIRIPGEAQYSTGRYTFSNSIDLTIEKESAGLSDLKAAVEDRRHEVSRKTRINKHNQHGSSIAESRQISANAFLIRSFSGDYVSLGQQFDPFSIELYLLVDSVLVKLQTSAYGEQGADGYLTAEKQLQDFTSQLRSLNEVPSKAGFCAGPILVSGAPSEKESADTNFSIPSHPDITLEVSVRSSAITLKDELLRNREQDGKSIFNRIGINDTIKTLHSGGRTVGDFKGYESLLYSSTLGEEGHSFEWQYPGGAERYSQPTIDVKLKTGERFDPLRDHSPSLTDAEARELWDAILNSIRLRTSTVQTR